MATAIAIETMTALGAPVSTTQVVTTSIMGAGSAKRRAGVRWVMARKFVTSWFVTLPVTMCLGAAFCALIGLFV